MRILSLCNFCANSLVFDKKKQNLLKYFSTHFFRHNEEGINLNPQQKLIYPKNSTPKLSIIIYQLSIKNNTSSQIGCISLIVGVTACPYLNTMPILELDIHCWGLGNSLSGKGKPLPLQRHKDFNWHKNNQHLTFSSLRDGKNGIESPHFLPTEPSLRDIIKSYKYLTHIEDMGRSVVVENASSLIHHLAWHMYATSSCNKNIKVTMKLVPKIKK